LDKKDTILDRVIIFADFIEKIIQLYTEVNPIWLVTGEGKMLKETHLVEESGLEYGKKDHFKQVLLQYLDDQEIQDKLIEIVNKG